MFFVLFVFAAHLDFSESKLPRRSLQEGSPIGVEPIKSFSVSAPDGSSSACGCLPLNTSLRCLSVAPQLMYAGVSREHVSGGNYRASSCSLCFRLRAYTSAFLEGFVSAYRWCHFWDGVFIILHSVSWVGRLHLIDCFGVTRSPSLCFTFV